MFFALMSKGEIVGICNHVYLLVSTTRSFTRQSHTIITVTELIYIGWVMYISKYIPSSTRVEEFYGDRVFSIQIELIVNQESFKHTSVELHSVCWTLCRPRNKNIECQKIVKAKQCRVYTKVRNGIDFEVKCFWSDMEGEFNICRSCYREFYVWITWITYLYILWSMIEMEILLWKILENSLWNSLNREDFNLERMAWRWEEKYMHENKD